MVDPIPTPPYIEGDIPQEPTAEHLPYPPIEFCAYCHVDMREHWTSCERGRRG